ncbi:MULTISPECIES: hypothetical protein [Vagococcus]|nr:MULTISPECIES: hypothetical protein [Vagococcus]
MKKKIKESPRQYRHIAQTQRTKVVTNSILTVFLCINDEVDSLVG